MDDFLPFSSTCSVQYHPKAQHRFLEIWTKFILKRNGKNSKDKKEEEKEGEGEGEGGGEAVIPRVVPITNVYKTGGS